MAAKKKEFAISCLLLLSLFLAINGRDCNDYRCTSTCALGRIVTDYTNSNYEMSGSCDPGCCTTPAGSCTPATAVSCCTKYMMKCRGSGNSYNSIYCSTSTSHGNYIASSYPVQYAYLNGGSRCKSSSFSPATCPPNFGAVNGGVTSSTCIFCVATQCKTMAGYDCTICLECNTGYRLLSNLDQSCQLPPAVTAGVNYRGTNYLMSAASTVAANFSTDTNLATSQMLIGGFATTAAKAAWTGSPALLIYAACSVNGANVVFINSSSSKTVQFNVSVGANTVACRVVDSNLLSTNMTMTVNIFDREVPRFTCSNVTLVLASGASSISFNWSNPTVVDNVGVTRIVCSGGPANYIFPFNFRTPVSVTCYAYDAANNNATCRRYINVVDLSRPVPTCPASVSINTALNSNGQTVTWAVSAVDNINTTSIVCTPALNSFVTIGSYNAFCLAADWSGNVGRCNISLQVVDNQAPNITCPPSPYVVSASASGSYSSQLLPISAADNSLVTPTIACTPGGQPIASNFSLGNTIVQCTATDAYLNPQTCSFVVDVQDTTAPVVTCPPVTLYTLLRANYSNLSSYNVTYFDNVNVVSSSCVPTASPTMFYVGATTVNCSAADAAANVGRCSFTVTVIDNESPRVNCSGNLLFSTNATSNIPLTFRAPTATDNVRVSSETLTITLASGQNIVIPATSTSYTISSTGSVSATYRATDSAGLVSVCYWAMTAFPQALANDFGPPVINGCPTATTSSAPAADYDSYPPSTYTIVVSTAPTYSYSLSFPPWNTLSATDDSGTVFYNYLDWSPNRVTATTNGLGVGRYVVGFAATDQRGNAAYCVFRIRVADTEAPAFINCPASQTYNTNGGSTAIATSWPTSGIVATDNYIISSPYGACVSTPPGLCPSPGTALTSPLDVGVYSFTYSASDDAGNAAPSCSFSISVVDNVPPVLAGCGTTLINTPTSPGTNTAMITSACPNVTASDNIGVTAITYTSTPLGYNCLTPVPITYGSGIIITIAAYDSVQSSIPCFIVVTVNDRENPTLSGCSTTQDTPVSAECDLNRNTANVSLPTITATDNSGTAIITVSSFPSGLRSGSAFPLGTSSVTYTATDPSGLRVSCTVKVTVVDRQAPVINGFPGGSSTYTYTLVTDNGLPTANLALPNITGADNVAISSAQLSPSSYTVNNAFNFPVGTTVLIFTAVDTSLNSVSATLLVIVTDNQMPQFINCPSSSINATIMVNTTLHQPTAPVTWLTISAVDNVDGNRVLVTQDSIPTGYTDGSLYFVGTTWIVYTASDVAGNINHCYFAVEVSDYEKPTILCPDNFTQISEGPMQDYALIIWRDPIYDDNYGLSSVSSNIPEYINYTSGLYNVTYTAVDTSGNAETCSFHFFVRTMTVDAPAASSAASSTSTFAAAGAAGGVLILLVVLVIVFAIVRRRTKKKLNAAQSGYAELMAMSDEFIVERARAIQQALVEQRQATPPAAVTSQAIHPERPFAAPPTTLRELEEYMRSTVNKEIPRDSLEFGAELGAGEFGAVHEGFYKRPLPEDKLKVAIKMLRKATVDDDKVRFLKEAAIMAQFNHPNIVSLTGVCTLPATEPTLIVLEYMHLGALHGYLQSPMVYDQLECLTMVRMALDVGAGMQYLAEAGFVHRDLAARNVLLDKTMTCRVGDFGLSVDLASAESSEGDQGVYSGEEGAKIPIRWTAIEAVCFRQFSTASDVWSFGVLLWEIWSYAELPYKGWNNKKVTEQVSAGYRLLKPSNCPDEVYKIMIECWNKNVKRRITFPKINEALVEVWKDVARGDHDDNNAADDEPQEEGGMYDNTTTRMELSDSEDDELAPSAPLSPTPQAAPAEDDDEAAADRAVDVPVFGGAAPTPAAKPTPAPAPVLDEPAGVVAETSLSSPAAPAPAPVPVPAPAVAPAPSKGTRGGISAADVGKKVTVTNFGLGVLRFFGPHHRDGKPRCGVEMNEAVGINNGTVGEFKYFECAPKHGVLVDPRMVIVADAAPAPLMLNPIYDATPSQPKPPMADGYLAVNTDD